MNTSVNIILFTLVLCATLAVAVLLVRWSVADAKLRGKSRLLVSLAVLFFFPWGLVAWVLFRPEPLGPTNSNRTFRLEDFRVQ
jgi:hypothetical protein